MRDRDYYEICDCAWEGTWRGNACPACSCRRVVIKMDVVGDAASDVVGGYAVGMSSGEEEKERGGGGGGDNGGD